MGFKFNSFKKQKVEDTPYTLKWTPQEGKQAKAWEYYLDNGTNIIGYGGTRGSGKSELMINGNLNAMYTLGNSFNGVYLRNNSSSLKDIIARFKKALYRDYNGTGKAFEWNSQDKVFVLLNGATIRFFYTENDGLLKLQGGNLTHITFEEPQYIGQIKELVKPQIDALWRSYEGVCKKQFWGFNPLGVSTKFLKEYFVDNGDCKKIIEPTGATKVFIRASLSDNPKMVENDPTYKKLLEELPEMHRKAWLDGDFDIQAGLAFDTLTYGRNGFNIVDGWKPDDYPWFISMDWGYTSKSCVGFYCLYKETILIRFDEIIFTQKTPEEAGWLIREKMDTLRADNFNYAIADTAIFNETQGVSIAGRIADMCGIFFMKSFKDRDTGFLRVYNYIKEQKFFITENCKYFWESVPLLVMSETKESDICQKSKQDDHCYDEVRYMIMSLNNTGLKK